MPWKLLFMGTVFESKPAQCTHLSLEPISGVCLILPIRNYACHLFLRRSHTSASCCQTLKFIGERSPQLNKLFFFSSFCLDLLMFLLLLVPTAIFFWSLSKQWLNPRLQSKASPSSPRELQQRQTDPACAKGFTGTLHREGWEGWGDGDQKHISALGWIVLQQKQTHLKVSLRHKHWTSNPLHLSLTSAAPLFMDSCLIQAAAEEPQPCTSRFPSSPSAGRCLRCEEGWQQRQNPQGDEGEGIHLPDKPFSEREDAAGSLRGPAQQGSAGREVLREMLIYQEAEVKTATTEQWLSLDEQEGLEFVNPRIHLSNLSGHAIHGKLFAKSPRACCSPSLGAEHPLIPLGLCMSSALLLLCQNAFENKSPEADPLLRLQHSKAQVYSLSLQGAITLKKLSTSKKKY